MPRTSVKSPDAFRTISEAADALDLPQHVLRFWETRFSQIKPMKRSGGRRYYRPTDIALLQGIRHLLYDEGYTIKGVQRILREQGVAHVAGLGANKAAALAPPEAMARAEPAPPRAQEPHRQQAAVPQRPAQISPASPALATPALASPAVFAAPMPAQNFDPAPAARPPAGAAHADVQPVPTGLDGQPSAAVGEPVAALPPSQAELPQPSQPIQPQPAPVSQPAQVLQPEAAPPLPTPNFPPLGGSAPSTLRFMPDVETEPQPAAQAVAPPAPAASPPMPNPAPPAVTPVQQPSVQAPSPGTQPRLNAQDTETLVQALRTLLDCKAILDSARQPKPNSGSATS